MALLSAIFHGSRFACPYCGASHSLRREERRGFLQIKLAAWLGLYPWECSLCRRVSFHKYRGQKKRR